MIEHANSRIAFHAAALNAALRVAAEAGDALTRIYEEADGIVEAPVIAFWQDRITLYRGDAEQGLRLASAASAMAKIAGEPYDEIIDDMYRHL